MNRSKRTRPLWLWVLGAIVAVLVASAIAGGDDDGDRSSSPAPRDAAALRATTAARAPATSGCDPSYAGACLKPGSADYDCSGGSGNGPDYTGTVQVVGDDHFGLDRDGNGTGCD